MADPKKPSLKDIAEKEDYRTASVKEELRKKKEKEQEYALNIKKVMDETAQELKEGKIDLAKGLQKLYDAEKMTRQANQTENTDRVAKRIIELCGEYKDWKALNENIVVLSKKRNQFKKVISTIVQGSMKYLDETGSKESKIELINTLRNVCEGKIYCEVELAHLVKMLVQIREAEGNIEEAATLIQTVQVETIGSMSSAEKISFILMQIRLLLDKKDYVRAFITSKKITQRSLERSQNKEFKVRYYRLLVRYWTSKMDFLEITKCYWHIFDVLKEEENVKKWSSDLQNLVIFICLSKFDNHQHDLKNRIWRLSQLEEPCMKVFQEMLRLFVNSELIKWQVFVNRFGQYLNQNPFFTNNKERQDILKTRIVEHNIRIISQYYSKMKTSRLSQLLDLSVEETEKYVSDLVTSNIIRCKMDRVDGITEFKETKTDVDYLNEWNSNIESVLLEVEKTSRLTERAEIVF